jgi:GNAT superfamily N-acetyltransferase
MRCWQKTIALCSTENQQPMLEIRAFRHQDSSDCSELFVQVFGLPPWNDRWSPESAGAYLGDIVHTPGFYGVVAFDGDRLVGVCLGHRKRWWQGDEYHIDELFVAPEAQRQGIGRQIIDYTKQELRTKGVGRLTLLTVRNTSADQFYSRLGFIPSEHLIFMKLDLFDDAELEEQ